MITSVSMNAVSVSEICICVCTYVKYDTSKRLCNCKCIIFRCIMIQNLPLLKCLNFVHIPIPVFVKNCGSWICMCIHAEQLMSMYVYTFAYIHIHVMIKNGTVCMHESHWSTHVAYTLEHTHTRRSYCSIRHTFTLSLQSAQCRFQCTVVRATESFGKKWLDFLLWPWHLMRAMDSRFRGLLLLRQRQWCSAPPGRLMSH